MAGDRINWYPGLMERTRRFLGRYAKHLDLCLEVCDARAPESTRWPGLAGMLGGRPRLLVLNKTDLADPAITQRWLAYYDGLNLPRVAVAAQVGGVRVRQAKLIKRAVRAALGVGRSPTAGGADPARRRAWKIAVLGVPNAGKSSLLNLIAGARRAPAGAKPGLTRGQQWVVAGKDLWLLDLPGVLPPTARDAAGTMHLGLLGIVPERAVPEVEAALFLLGFLLATVGGAGLCGRLRIEPPADPPADERGWLTTLAAKRGLLRAGGVPDLEGAAAVLVAEFRRGALGRLSLQEPPADDPA